MEQKTFDIEKLKKEIEALEVETEQTREAVSITPETKLSVLWAKVSPFVMLLGTMVRGKLKLYLNAFSAAIEELIKKEETEEVWIDFFKLFDTVAQHDIEEGIFYTLIKGDLKIYLSHFITEYDMRDLNNDKAVVAAYRDHTIVLSYGGCLEDVKQKIKKLLVQLN